MSASEPLNNNDHWGTKNLRYRLLGPVAARDEGRLSGKMRRTVLAALLLDANRIVSEDHLIDVLWGASPPASARGQLQVRISELRKVLGRTTIVHRAPGYLIDIRPGELDLQVFESAIAGARTHLSEGRTTEGIAGLRAALELWQGQPLGGVTDGLLDRARPMLDELRLSAFEDLVAAELTMGLQADVLRNLWRVCHAHPFRERAQALLMRALQQAGRVPDALEVYAQLRRRLTTELGIEPGTELQQAHLDILNGDHEEDAPAETRAAPVVRPAELPYDARGFAGRSAALELLDAHLPDGEAAGTASAVWVIHGAAGVGKTATAVHWAWQVRRHFPDGQLYLDLRGFDVDDKPMTPGVALSRLLRSLGTDPQRIPAEVEAQAGLYRSLLADRQMLLVLDNVRDAEQVFPLLPPAGTVLVTSRHRLTELVARIGARSLPLDVLAPADSQQLLGTVLGAGRVAEEPQAAEELARLCGYLPLALRIAAANITAAPAPKIADLVAELAGGSRLAALAYDGEDQDTLTRAFDASYQALPPESQKVFRLLGLIPGADFTTDVAAAVTGLPPKAATRQLTTLAAAHLIEQHATNRFRFHDLVREYAVERVQAEEPPSSRDEAWRRLVESFIATGDAARERFGPPSLELPREQRLVHSPTVEFPDARSAATWFDTENCNLSATLRRAIAQGPFPEAWYLTDVVRLLTNHTGMWASYLSIADDLLAAAKKRKEPRVAALIVQSIGTANIYHGSGERAVEHLREAVEAHRRCGWQEAEAVAMNALGVALQGTGRFAEAIQHYQSAVRLHHPLGNRIGEMMALSNLGFARRQVGQLDEAIPVLERALSLAAAEHSRSGTAAALVCLGFVRHLRGETASALDTFTQARDTHSELGYRYGESYALSGLSLVRTDLGAYHQARRDAFAALELARHQDHRETELAALNALSRAEAALGLFDQAHDHQNEAVGRARRANSPWYLTEAMTGLCELQNSAGDPVAAITTGTEALTLARANGLRPLEARSLIGLARAHAATGNEREAAALLDQALSLARKHGFGAIEAEARRQRIGSPSTARLISGESTRTCSAC